MTPGMPERQQLLREEALKEVRRVAARKAREAESLQESRRREAQQRAEETAEHAAAREYSVLLFDARMVAFLAGLMLALGVLSLLVAVLAGAGALIEVFRSAGPAKVGQWPLVTILITSLSAAVALLLAGRFLHMQAEQAKAIRDIARYLQRGRNNGDANGQQL